MREANPIETEKDFGDSDRLMAAVFALCTPALIFKEHPELLEDLLMRSSHYDEVVQTVEK